MKMMENKRNPILTLMHHLHSGCPMYDSFYFCQGRRAQDLPWWPGRSQGRRTLAFISTLDTGPTTLTIDLGEEALLNDLKLAR